MQALLHTQKFQRGFEFLLCTVRPVAKLHEGERTFKFLCNVLYVYVNAFVCMFVPVFPFEYAGVYVSRVAIYIRVC